MMKIYFAASIRGGRDYASWNDEMVAELKKYGKVLTEHVGDAHKAFHSEDVKVKQSIYREDVSWLREADIVIAEVSSPSLGVGYEIGMAEEMRKPIHCFFRTDSNFSLSAMIDGNEKLKVYRYSNLEDFKIIASRIFTE